MEFWDLVKSKSNIEILKVPRFGKGGAGPPVIPVGYQFYEFFQGAIVSEDQFRDYIV